MESWSPSFRRRWTVKSLLAVALRLGTSGLAGLLAAQVMPPTYGPWLTLPIGIAALYLLARNQAGWLAGLVGLSGGVGYFLPLLRWMEIVGVDAWLLLTTLCAVWWFVAFSFLPRVAELRFIPFAFATVWTAAEILRDSVPWGGFGWAQFGVATPLTPFNGLAPNVGQLGATWIMIFSSCLLGEWLYLRQLPKVTAKTVALGLSLAAVALNPFNFGLSTAPNTARLSIVQGGVDHYGLGTFGDIRSVLKHHAEVTSTNKSEIDQTDLVVWPENAADVNPQTDVVAAGIMNNLVREIKPPILLGAVQAQSDNTLHNISLLWTRVGYKEIYVKRKIVPFGEFMPMREFITSITDRAALMPRDFSSGKRHGSIDVNNVHFGTLICFEVADAGLALTDDDQASAWIVHTNNATYQFTGQSEQQLLAGQMRAAETQRPFIISSTSGISAIIDTQGHVTDQISQTETGIMIASFSTITGKTGAMLLYPFLRLVIPAMALALIAAALRRRKRTS